MNRVTFTFTKDMRIERVCADQPTAVYVIRAAEPVDQAHLWSTVNIGPDAVDAEVSNWPVSDQYEFPSFN